jgi:hypothetical protein
MQIFHKIVHSSDKVRHFVGDHKKRNHSQKDGSEKRIIMQRRLENEVRTIRLAHLHIREL